MARGQATAEAILYGRWNPTTRQLVDETKSNDQQFSKLRLGKRQRYTLHLFTGHGSLSVKDARKKLEANLKISRGQALDLLRKLEEKGLLENHKKGKYELDYQLSDWGFEVVKHLSKQGKI